MADVPTYAPTPTQEENDLARMGQGVVEKESDGSDEQPSIVPATTFVMPLRTRQMEAKKPAAESGYSTRSVAPKQATPLPPPSPPAPKTE